MWRVLACLVLLMLADSLSAEDRIEKGPAGLQPAGPS